PARFTPVLEKPPIFGAVNILKDKVVREYLPVVNGTPSLAVRSVEAIGKPLPEWAHAPFRLHYYAPHEWNDKGKVRRAYKFVSAWTVFTAQSNPKRALELGITPD